MPAISIIVPVYNAQRTLRRCVDSILRSTFQDFELILIDDCSVDNSKEICEEYVYQYGEKVRLIALVANGGVSAARNAGIDAAYGEYLMFADSDDYVAENWCEALYRTQLQYPGALIVCNMSDVCYNGEIKPRKLEVGGAVRNMLYVDLFLSQCSGSLCNKIFRKEKLLKHNIKFKREYKIGEDAIFNVEYIKQCNHIVGIDQSLYFYCEESNSATHKYHEDWLAMHLTPFYARLALIEDAYISIYCDSWFPFFIWGFKNIFDERCTKSFIEKMRYNHKVMQSKEFRFCAEHISEGKESKLFMSVVKTYNYYALWLFQCLMTLKKKLRDVIKIK